MKYGRYRHHPERRNVTVVGGILGLESRYRDILEEGNFKPRIYNKAGMSIGERVAAADLIILFAGTVSHKMAREVRRSAIAHDVPLVTIVPSSLTALKNFISCPHPGRKANHNRNK